MLPMLRPLSLALIAASTALAAHAMKPQPPAVQVEGAWVRATVQGQSGTGGFMRLKSSRDLTLLGFRTPVAGTAELHEMAMQGDVMRMRPVEALPLPAGRSVELKPGGHHLMLMDLKRPLSAGSTVRLVLKLKAGDGKTLEQAVNVPVRASAPAGGQGSADGHDHHGHDHHDHHHH